MKILNLYVTGQNITLQDSNVIISGSQDYLGLKFKFGNDWEQYEKAYRFIWQQEAYTAIELDGIVKVPHEVIKPPYFIIAVGGSKGTEFVPTAALKIPVKENGFGDPDENIAPSEPASALLLTQLLQLCASKVPQTRTIAGIDLRDNIAKEDLLGALNVAEGAEVNIIRSVAGKTGEVTLTKSDVELGNVDNTSDMDKPVSTAQQAAFDAKQDALIFDDTPIENSNNPVKSGGVHRLMQLLWDEIATKAEISNVYAKTEVDTKLDAKERRINAAFDAIFDIADDLTDIQDIIPSEANRQNLLADKNLVLYLHNLLDAYIADIEDKIPAQATSQNKLADKEFVNSSIATETAHYISNNGQPFANPASLPTDSSVTNNDYAFVTGTDGAGNTYYDRYKATVSNGAVSWGKEFRLNNSSFTAEQWSAITSGITAVLVAQINANATKLAGIENGAEVNKIEGIQINGTNLTPDAGRKVNITNIPKEALASGVQTVIDNTDLAIRTAMYGEDLTPADNSYFIFTSINGGTAYSISSKYINAGEYTVSFLNDAQTHNERIVYTLSDSGTLTEGNVSVEAGDKVVWKSSKWTVFTDTLLNGNLVIPYEYNGKPVQAIANSGFTLTRITSVTIPGSIETIGGWAFTQCNGLSAVTICKGVKTLAVGAFADSPNLSAVIIPDSVTRIDETPHIFRGSQPTVYCSKGSYAEEYCALHNTSYVYPEISENKVRVISAQSTDKEYPSAKAVYNALKEKPDKNGSYEDMSVGNAEQLKSIAFVRDKKPYNFRSSGGGADIGDRDYTDEIVGGTIVWNQIFSNPEITITGLTITRTGNGSYRANGTIETEAYVTFNNITCNANRVYLFALNSKNADIFLMGTNADPVYANTQKFITKENVDFNPGIYFKAETYNNVEFIPQIFDLTLMFGSDIANYLYTLETGSGTGVAWFTKLFPKNRYDYDDGLLLNVHTDKHITTGFNQWDEEWEVGAINTSTGANSTNANTIRSKNYIKVIPNTTYYFKGDLSGGIFFYDEDKSYIAGATQYVSNTTYITPNDAHYARFTCGSTYGNTYKHDICVNLSWDGTHNGEYQEYEVREYPLETLTLRGIPKLDVNNNLYYDGDTYEHEGAVTRKYGAVDLGTLGWSKNDTYTNPIFVAKMPDDALKNTTLGLADERRGICKSYIWYKHVGTSYNYWQNISDKSMVYIGTGLSGNNNLYIRDDNYQTAADFKAAVTGIVLLYELAAPETETAEPFQYPQIVNDFGTEEFVDPSADMTGVAMPVGHNTRYTNNLRAKLDMAPNSPDDDGDYILRRTNGINSYARYTGDTDEERLAALERIGCTVDENGFVKFTSQN